jgi:hypothetical protein
LFTEIAIHVLGEQSGLTELAVSRVSGLALSKPN